MLIIGDVKSLDSDIWIIYVNTFVPFQYKLTESPVITCIFIGAPKLISGNGAELTVLKLFVTVSLHPLEEVTISETVSMPGSE